MDRPTPADSRARQPLDGPRLFAVYAVATLVPMVLLGLAVNAIISREIDRRALAEAVTTTRTISESAIEPNVGERVIRKELTPEQRRQLSAATASLLDDGELLRLRVRSSTGTIVFDARHPDARPQPDVDEEVQEAADGHPVNLLTHVNADEVDGSAPDGEAAVESYVALRSTEGDRVVGVVEMYLRYRPYAQAAERVKSRVQVALLTGLVLLWGALAAVSWSVSRRLRSSAKDNEWLARHDQLTRLPNRLSFTEEIEATNRLSDLTWVAVVDVARFREVNETVGHANGDRFLVEIARRLRVELGLRRMVARLGGDHFGVLWPHDGAGSDARLLAAIDAVCQDPIEVAGIKVNVELSVGLASSVQVRGSASELLRAADLAVHAAKEAGVTVLRYAPELEQFDPDRLALAAELGPAIAAGQMVLHYQPKLNLVTGEVRSVEALVRWEHPERGLVSPGTFIPIAETTSLFRPLTAWVIEEAARQMSVWQRMDPPITVSVNISARSLVDPDLPEFLLRVLNENNVPLRNFELEITETALIVDPKRATALLRRLHDAGVRISLDDFGQGATSLVSLTDLPLDELKIDRKFVVGLEQSDEQRAVVEFVIALGQRLGLTVVAEGIENERSATLLTSMGCDEGQGFLFCRPLPQAELERWLGDHNRRLHEVSERSESTSNGPIVPEPTSGDDDQGPAAQTP